MKCMDCKFVADSVDDRGTCDIDLPKWVAKRESYRGRDVFLHEFGDGCDLGQPKPEPESESKKT